MKVMKHILSALIVLSSLTTFAAEPAKRPARAAKQPAKSDVDYVNPMIGTSGMGHTFPGACAPFGIVQLSPETDTIPQNIDGKYQPKVYAYCAGYQHDDPTIVGFSHTHLSGTGHSDLGDILIMPETGKLQLNPGTADNPDGGYRSRFSHSTEVARAGYYEVTLADNGVRAQLTATQRVGVHRYTFPKGGDSRLIIDLLHGIYNYDGKVLWSSLRVHNDTLLTGFRMTEGWARCRYTYFAISFSKPVVSYGYRDMKRKKYQGFWRNLDIYHNFPEMAGRDIVAYFNFDNLSSQELTVKVALSAVSEEGAMKNLRAEAAGKTFDQIYAETRRAWEKELGSIECEGTDDQKAMIYTSLYHTLINPSVYMDVDRKYRGVDGAVHVARDFDNYTIFSLWDTYRAEHPLLLLLKTPQAVNMVKSMIAHQRQSAEHMLPVWSLMGNEGWCMTGYHAVSVLADALVKTSAIDRTSALEAMRATADNAYYGHLPLYRKYGYVPFDREACAASSTLEYSYDDWAIYAAARWCGREDMVSEFRPRALYYRNTFDKSIGFASPRYTDGRFKEKLDPYQTYGEGFIEGNSYNYSFSAPHDVLGLIATMGGESKFLEKLNALFRMNLPEKYYKDNEDITAEGLVGGYVHGNEPSHHIPYLYAWTSTPWMTQYWLRTIMDRMYRNNIRGLSGNDDCGQMSAWYIFTAMGFYPVCPGSDQYVLGAPYLPYMKVNLPGGKSIVIKAPKVSDKNCYVASVKLNGKPYSKLYITHRDLTEGCTIEFEMSSRPNKKRGLAPADKPYSLTDGSALSDTDVWKGYNMGKIDFLDKAPDSEGSRIYHSIIPDPDSYIRSVARTVLSTLYSSPADSIPPMHRLRYTLEDIDGVSAKGGGGGNVSIFYSTRHIQRSFAGNDTAKVLFETRGVLLHELTHAFQLEPQGIGDYGSNKTFWAFIEGMSDAVRVANSGFHDLTDRPRGGSYKDGYRYTGYFLVWLRDRYDRDFLRKFNHTALELNPWSWNGAIKKVLGEKYDIDELWREYVAEQK